MLFSRSETQRGVELMVGFTDSMFSNLSVCFSWCPSPSNSSTINCWLHIFDEKKKVTIESIFVRANVAIL